MYYYYYFFVMLYSSFVLNTLKKISGAAIVHNRAFIEITVTVVIITITKTKTNDIKDVDKLVNM